MGIPLKTIRSQYVVVSCLLLALLCANTHTVCSLSSTTKAVTGADWGNGNVTTGDAFVYVGGGGGGGGNDYDEEEFLMDSEINRRILVGAFNPLINPAKYKDSPYCDTNGKIANCDSLRANNMQSRPCTLENRCKRG